MKGRSLVFTLLVAVGLLGYPSYRVYRHLSYPATYALVSHGDTEALVIAKMGAPDDVQTQKSLLWCKEPETVREYLYGDSLPPQWWVIGFNQAGHVSCTEELDSP